LENGSKRKKIMVMSGADEGQLELDERKVRKIYLGMGFKIVDIIDYDHGRSMALYEYETGIFLNATKSLFGTLYG